MAFSRLCVIFCLGAEVMSAFHYSKLYLMWIVIAHILFIQKKTFASEVTPQQIILELPPAEGSVGSIVTNPGAPPSLLSANEVMERAYPGSPSGEKSIEVIVENPE